jgi:hypothetical protein
LCGIEHGAYRGSQLSICKSIISSYQAEVKRILAVSQSYFLPLWFCQLADLYRQFRQIGKIGFALLPLLLPPFLHRDSRNQRNARALKSLGVAGESQFRQRVAQQYSRRLFQTILTPQKQSVALSGFQPFVPADMSPDENPPSVAPNHEPVYPV